MLAPPWIAVPPPGYGGVESVVSVLTEALMGRGHEVTLFCAPGSTSSARVETMLDEAHPDEIERSLYEVDHVARAFAAIDRSQGEHGFDVVHDHCGFTALGMADRLVTPLVHTLHGQFTRATAAFYAQHQSKATLVAISRAQRATAPEGLVDVRVIPNPIDVQSWPMREHKEDYLLWIGRMSVEKGPHRAIEAARAAGVRLVLAGVIQPGQQAFFDREVGPHIDGERVSFLGEIGGPLKRSVFAGARALLMPITWEEPFGMVMVEALTCGTPVIAFPTGAATELVIDGRTGFLVEDETAMAAAVGRLGTIAARDCRAWVAEHCDVDVVAGAYERAYRTAAHARKTAMALSERTFSVLDGSTFVVSDRLGDVRNDEGPDHGFFCQDTRFLSRWVLRVSEKPLELLGLDQAGALRRPVLLDAPRRPGDRGPVLGHATALDRPCVDGGVSAHQPSPRDQHDPGRARARHGLRRPVRSQGRGGRSPGRVTSQHDDRCSTLSYEREGFRRSVTISSSVPAAVTSRRVHLLADARSRRAMVDHFHHHSGRRAVLDDIQEAQRTRHP